MSEEKQQDNEIIDNYFDPRMEYLQAACNAIDTLEGVDLMFKGENERKNRIIRKSFEIIEDIINEFHSEYFAKD